MSANNADRLTFVVTAHAAKLLRGRIDLEDGLGATDETPDHVRVLLATPTDDARSLSDSVDVRLAVVEDPETDVLDETPFDDYVFSSATRSEIVFRALCAHSRHSHSSIRLNLTSLEVDGQLVPLSMTEHRILTRLMAQPAIPVGRTDLELTIDDDKVEVQSDLDNESRALDAHIYRLRRKLRGLPGIRLETHRNRGFSIYFETAPRSH